MYNKDKICISNHFNVTPCPIVFIVTLFLIIIVTLGKVQFGCHYFEILISCFIKGF